MSKLQKRHSDEEILEQLAFVAKEIGRTPTSFDISMASGFGYIVSSRTIYLRFGSLRNAQKLAGLTPNNPPARVYKKKYSDEQLIDQLKKFGKYLGRTPTLEDIDYNDFQCELASSATFAGRFGSFSKAIELAGFSDFQKRLTLSYRNEKQIFEFLNDIAVEMNSKIPTKTAFDQFARSHKYGCSVKSLIDNYGSLEAAFSAAGIEIEVMTDDQRREEAKANYLAALQDYIGELGYVPSIEKMKAAKAAGDFPYGEKMPYTLFGSWPKAVRAAGFEYVPTKFNPYAG